MPQSFTTFSGASTDLANFQALDVPKTASVRTGSQFVRFFGHATGAAASTFTLEVALIVDGERIGYWEATCTLDGTARTDTDLPFTVVFTEGSASKFDLLGADDYTIAQLGGTQQLPNGKAYWAVGVTAVSGASNIDLYAAYSSTI